MNSIAELRDLVEDRIRRAFDGVTLGDGVSLRQAEVIDRHGEGVTDEEFAKLPLAEVTKQWDQVPFSELERGNVAHLDPDGFRYYIPALMLSVLSKYDSCSMRVIGTLSSLYPNGDSLAYYKLRYDALSFEQKRAIACFMQALPKLVPLWNEDIKVAERAMRYWREFLPIVIAGAEQHDD
jgi:hypothetical protein